MPILVLALFACSKEPEESAAPITTPTPTDTQTDTEPTAGEPCPYAGTWNLAAIFCDGLDVTDTLPNLVEVKVLASDSPGGGCLLEWQYTGDTCVEAEQADASLISGDSWSMDGFGVTSCKPLGCDFGGADFPCELGDREGTWTETLTVDGAYLVSSRSGGVCSVVLGGTVTEAYWSVIPAPTK
jgi:hypothetical protein